MNQRQRILELVKNDSITVEQGMELMSALETPNRLPMRPPVPPVPPAQPAWKTASSSVKVGRPLASGSGQLSFDQVVQLGVHGVQPNYIEEMRKAGLEDMPFHDLMQLIVHRIPVSYVLQLRDLEQQLGIEALSVTQIVQLGIHKISISDVLEMRRLGIEHGFAPLTVDQIVQLGIHEIKPSDVLELLKTGAFNLNTPPAVKTDFEQRRAKLEVKLAKVDAKLERATAEAQRQKLLELREELIDEIKLVDSAIADALEMELEAEIHAELEPPQPVVAQTCDILSSVDPALPMAAQQSALEEMIQQINAQIGVATDANDRATLLEVHAQITAELAQLKTQ